MAPDTPQTTRPKAMRVSSLITTVAFCLAFQVPAASAVLVSHWPGEGDANDVVDANHGILVNGATATAGGVVGQAFSFDGTDDGVSVADSLSLDLTGSFTIDAWVKFFSIAPTTQHWVAGKAGTYQMVVRADQRLAVAFFNPLTSSFVGAATTSPVPTGVFVHLAGTYDQPTGQVKVYVDGNLGATASLALGTPVATNDFSFYIGGVTGEVGVPPQQFSHAIIDEVELYNHALTQAEIAELASPVPEPATLTLIAAGATGLAVARRLRRRRENP